MPPPRLPVLLLELLRLGDPPSRYGRYPDCRSRFLHSWLLKEREDQLFPLAVSPHDYGFTHLPVPARSFSYELQRRLVKAAVQNPFHESVAAIADLTGVSVPKRSLEEILRDAALDFDAFYQERASEPAKRLHPRGGGRWQGHSYGQARRRTTHRATHQGTESQPEENGHRSRRVHPRALGTHPRTGRGKACSVPDGRRPPKGRLPRARRTSGCGPVCSKVRPLSLRRWPKRCSAVIRKVSRLE